MEHRKTPKRRKRKNAPNLFVSSDDDTICTICLAEFLDPDDLSIHKDQFHSIKSSFVKCKFCEDTFSDIETTARHIRDAHICDMLCCSYCSRAFIDADTMKKHKNKHYLYVERSKYACSVCKTLFGNVSDLEMHEVLNHKDVGDGVFLHDYYSILSSILNIKAQTLLGNLGVGTVYVCVQCEDSFPDISTYITHLKTKNCYSLACHCCSNVYNGKRTLNQHFRNHKECHIHDKSDNDTKLCTLCKKIVPLSIYHLHYSNCKVVICGTCDMIFSNLDLLSTHKAEAHPMALKLLKCDLCQREFANVVTLNKHMDSVHKPNFHLYKYKCILCKKLFMHPKNLFAHYFGTHKEIQPYTCKICDIKFRKRKTFTFHIKMKHNSAGFVEFDENYYVFFTENKSEKPFKPYSLLGTADKNKDSNTSLNSETERKIPRKRKLNTVRKSKEMDPVDSDDEPLLALKKKGTHFKNMRIVSRNKLKPNVTDCKKRFTCHKCKKYCYTFQNYHNHISLHFKDHTKKCIKCHRTFQTSAALEKHVATEHKTSKLTETLKSLLYKRKSIPAADLTTTQKFMRTIKKVKDTKDVETAKISISNESSVKTYLETFLPDKNDTNRKAIELSCDITVKQVPSQYKKEPIIKMTKFNPGPIVKKTEGKVKLCMPVKFKVPANDEKHIVTVKLVPNRIGSPYSGHDYTDNVDTNDYDDNNAETIIPDIAQEVMLDTTEPSASLRELLNKKVFLPKNTEGISIAHLIPEAPYFKIVKYDKLLSGEESLMKKVAVPKVPKPPKVSKPTSIKLPDGTKLVSVNPLAHLLGNKPLEPELPKRAYHPKKILDIEEAMTKAMMNVGKAVRKTKKSEMEQ